jgi:hypothetical protein
MSERDVTSERRSVAADKRRCALHAPGRDFTLAFQSGADYEAGHIDELLKDRPDWTIRLAMKIWNRPPQIVVLSGNQIVGRGSSLLDALVQASSEALSGGNPVL